MNTEFSKQLSYMWDKIGSHGVMVLSTSAENRVTSRPVSVVVINGKFYFQTDKSYLKCRQLEINENAALSFENFSIEGKCRDIGRPYNNEFFTDTLKECYPSAYERWSALESERVLEFTPTLIYSWSYENERPYMEYWNFEKSSYRKEYKQ